MKAQRILGFCSVLAFCAGASLSTAAVADGLMADKASANLATPQKKDPIAVRGVTMINGKVFPTTDWIAYKPGAGTRGPTLEYGFDAYEPAAGPFTAPDAGRYLLGFTTGVNDYSAPQSVCDMVTSAAGAGAASVGFDVIWQERDPVGGGFTMLVFTTDAIDETCTGPAFQDADVLEGIEVGFAPAAGFWYSNIDLRTAGLTIALPADGAGGYIQILAEFVDPGTGDIILAPNSQPGLWGTGEDEVPPENRAGTNDIIQWVDDATFPDCAIDLSTNIPDGQFDPLCECYDYTFFAPPPADTPAVLATSIGFVIEGGGTCPADFDDSGTLTLNDFVQFRNAYVSGDLRADFDGSGTLTLNDFVQFRNAYVAGCP